MATIRPEHLAAIAGDPPLFAVGCVGAVEQVRELPDGRFHLLLLGTARFRIESEPPRPAGRLYRIASVALLGEEDAPEDATRLAERRARVTELLRLLVGDGDSQPQPLDWDSLTQLDDASFVSGLAQALDLEPLERQSLIEASGTSHRCGVLQELLEFRLGAAQANLLSGPSMRRPQ